MTNRGDDIQASGRLIDVRMDLDGVLCHRFTSVNPQSPFTEVVDFTGTRLWLFLVIPSFFNMILEELLHLMPYCDCLLFRIEPVPKKGCDSQDAFTGL